MSALDESNPFFPLYGHDRQSCVAGYYLRPQVYSGMKFELRRIAMVKSRVVKEGTKKWELWSPNSYQTPFLPGLRAGGALPSLLPVREDRRYDGHVGRHDCLYSPQYSGEDIAHWPYMRRVESVRVDDFAYVAYEPLMYEWEVDRKDRRLGRFRPEFIERLSALRRDLDARMLASGPFRPGSPTWARRPQYSTAERITELLGSWDNAVDLGSAVQRGLREKEGFLTMMHARRCMSKITMEQLRGVAFPMADDRFIGVWINGLPEGASLFLMYLGIPCFIVHSYASEDLTRADVHPDTPIRGDFVADSDIVTALLQGPYQCLARRDATKLDDLHRPPTTKPPTLISSPEEEKCSSSLYLEQMGPLQATWKRSDFDPNPQAFDLLGWREGSAVHTATPPAPLIFVPPTSSIPAAASGPSTVKKDRFAHKELQRRSIHPSRVDWVVPPPVADRHGGKWAKYEFTELESGRRAFLYRGKDHPVEAKKEYFDRKKGRRIFMGSYRIPDGVLNEGVFGVPVPQFPFIVMNGEREVTEFPSYWMYSAKEPKRSDVGKIASDPKVEELPFRDGGGPSASEGKGKGKAKASEQDEKQWEDEDME
ncbi:hypothetical protein R3P38DRAFT_2518454, partial [Favolaschia claudopus]